LTSDQLFNRETKMQDSIVLIYCLCDDFLRAHNHRDDVQCRWSSAQVMTASLVAARHFQGNIEASRRFLLEHGYFTQGLSKSRLNRRLHALPEWLWHGVFGLLSQVFQKHNTSRTFIVDSFPVAVCQPVRIHHCRVFPFERCRSLLGYIPSKKRYFYGLRLHLLTTEAGEPVEFVLSDGSCADLSVFKSFALNLESGSTILADKAYNDYAEEQLLQQAGGITLMPLRKKNLKRQWKPWQEAGIKRKRQRIETAFNFLTHLLPRRIHAVTPDGFALKILFCLLAFSLHCLQR
jgi:transposase